MVYYALAKVAEMMLEEKVAYKARITALICALNEEENLPHVLSKIPEWVDEIILVDGHSGDNTVEVARGLQPGIRILYQPGKGKADALAYGVAQATGDIIVTLDADGETDPGDIPHFVEPLLNRYDFAKGSRLATRMPHRMSRYRWFGNKILAFTCNLLYHTRFTDICSGYNAFWKAGFLKLGLTYDMSEIGCSMEQQMIIRAKKTGMKIKEVPHASFGRITGFSRISGFKQSTKQGFIDLFVVIRERFHA